MNSMYQMYLQFSSDMFEQDDLVIHDPVTSNPSQKEITPSRKDQDKLKDLSTIKWLRQRYQAKAKEQYLYNNNDIKRCDEIVQIFQKFDEDKSGTLEIEELYEMFNQNDILITKEELQDIFKVVDEDGSGQLSIDEFKRFILSTQNKQHFRAIMRQIDIDTSELHAENTSLSNKVRGQSKEPPVEIQDYNDNYVLNRQSPGKVLQQIDEIEQKRYEQQSFDKSQTSSKLEANQLFSSKGLDYYQKLKIRKLRKKISNALHKSRQSNSQSSYQKLLEDSHVLAVSKKLDNTQSIQNILRHQRQSYQQETNAQHKLSQNCLQSSSNQNIYLTQRSSYDQEIFKNFKLENTKSLIRLKEEDRLIKKSVITKLQPQINQRSERSHLVKNDQQKSDFFIYPYDDNKGSQYLNKKQKHKILLPHLKTQLQSYSSKLMPKQDSINDYQFTDNQSTERQPQSYLDNIYKSSNLSLKQSHRILNRSENRDFDHLESLNEKLPNGSMIRYQQKQVKFNQTSNNDLSRSVMILQPAFVQNKKVNLSTDVTLFSMKAKN
ncbi:ef hand family protein [Stylonychia lemnae]|uniref:Ef hand family protein n=1 Tax=Stylonychia lemnae TaxID=5949 RepID=A0A077ZQT4_STYLE|nr:ef hand family protein [Stylonychia lemnae]|eukprot:CDW72267.1 ef hand family protein [Stylonychia lemnae]